MATERDLELLDDYLANRMDGAERSSFENRLQADPDLQSELNLQQSLIDGIKKTRAAELKAMLQNVPVAGPGAEGLSTGAKLAISSFVAVIITAGVYLYVSKTEANEMVNPVQTVEPATDSDSQPSVQEGNEQTQPVEQSDEEAGRKAPAVSKQTTPATQPTVKPFDATETEGETAVAGDESPRTSSDNGGSRLAVEVDKAHAEYKFNYQFRDGKLFLYGPFENNLYEIMEFISDQKTTMFLYYRSNYYLLKDDSDRIKPLTAITDPTLLKKLREYRKK
jgi:hypothetical protein